jgi:hypothetical protein
MSEIEMRGLTSRPRPGRCETDVAVERGTILKGIGVTDTSPEIFNAALALLAVAADVKGTRARLAELQQQIDAAEKAQAKLDAAQPVHDQTAAALEAREAAVTERERIVAAEEEEYYRLLPKERFPLGANGEPGTRSWSGLTREAEHG